MSFIFSKMHYKMFPQYPTRIRTTFTYVWGEREDRVRKLPLPKNASYRRNHRKKHGTYGSRSKPWRRLCSDPPVTTNPKHREESPFLTLLRNPFLGIVNHFWRLIKCTLSQSEHSTRDSGDQESTHRGLWSESLVLAFWSQVRGQTRGS